MTLQFTGQISMGDINVELMLASTDPINLNGNPYSQGVPNVVRLLAGIPTEGSPISMADFYGKDYDWNSNTWGGIARGCGAEQTSFWGATISAGISINNNGQFTLTNLVTPGYNPGYVVDYYDWHHTPNDSDWGAYGDDFYVKWVLASGYINNITAESMQTQNTWYSLAGTNRQLAAEHNPAWIGEETACGIDFTIAHGSGKIRPVTQRINIWVDSSA